MITLSDLTERIGRQFLDPHGLAAPQVFGLLSWLGLPASLLKRRMATLSSEEKACL